MPLAQENLMNFLTPNIKEVVRKEVQDPQRAQGKLYGRPRIYNNLLSSQPLCFNLFGELCLDLNLATKTIREMSNGRVDCIVGIDFEYSPGRGDKRYLGDKSAFDVYIRYKTKNGGQGFIGIEVKYHKYKVLFRASDRYEDISIQMNCFLTRNCPN